VTRVLKDQWLAMTIAGAALTALVWMEWMAA